MKSDTTMNSFASVTRRIPLAVAAILMTCAGHVQAATRTVSTTAQFETALAQSADGDVIVMTTGRYGNVSISDVRKSVTLRGNGSAVVDQLTVNNSASLMFDGLFIDSGMRVINGTNVTLSNLVLDGSTDGAGFAKGRGLEVSESTGITLRNSELRRFNRGASWQKSKEIKILDNVVHSMSGDAMTFAAVQDVLIEGNTFKDMRGNYNSGHHEDMIQFWTTGTNSPSTNVTIRDNTINPNNTMAAINSGKPHSTTNDIFMGNERASSNNAMYYQNSVIENNRVTASDVHGIAIGHARGLTIRNNTVLADPRVTSNNNRYVPKISVVRASTGVTISGNKLHALGFDLNANTNGNPPASWTVTNNTFVSAN